MARLLGPDDVAQVLRLARVVAVLGAHPEMSRPAHYVPAYLLAAGYRILPVNPGFAGETLFGEVVRETLTELTEPVDVVDVFRRSGELPAHVPDILAMAPLPKVVWLQLGIRHDEVAGQLVAAGVDVIQDRCMLRDHRRLSAGG
jgi:predicted CoA-binding protein